MFPNAKRKLQRAFITLLEELKSTVTYSGRARLMLSGSVLANLILLVQSKNKEGWWLNELCTSTRYWGDAVDVVARNHRWLLLPEVFE